MNEHLSFRLPEAFVDGYADRKPNWGFPIGAGNTLGELTYISKYSRVKPDGTKERWHETCRRVIEGMFSILKDHCEHNQTPWKEWEAQDSAQEAYDRLWNFKWTPPGRGLWMMGTQFVAEQGSAALQNCAFLSTENLRDDPIEPFTSLMEMSMLGIGVGFDTNGQHQITVRTLPDDIGHFDFVIPDSREGWVDSVRLLLEAWLGEADMPRFDYSLIRPAGEPIKGFGGVAAGPEPLRRLHVKLGDLMTAQQGKAVTSRTITDIMNLIGKCVVAGNVRRSAEIAFGYADDKDFVSLKDWNLEENAERMGEGGWGHMSNNSVLAKSGEDYTHLVDRIAVNGEPGLMYLDLAQQFGRLGDPRNDRDYRVKGANPCVEQSLEDHELCTLVETFPTHHDSLNDYLRTLKFAYMYGKAVTLLPTHWPQVNEVMTRNRRIGTSMTGIAQFVERHGYPTLREWCDAAYYEIRRRDVQYSEWLGVRESIKVTSVKPSGTVSLLAGVTPGVHWPVAAGSYVRTMRYSVDDPTVPLLEAAGYHVEPELMDPDNTVVVSFPTAGPDVRSEREVSVWEKMKLAALLQAYWADNMVSATFTFRSDEADQIGPAIHSFDGQLKSMSFMPLLDTGSAYRQMPYQAIDSERMEAMQSTVKPLDLDVIYASGREAEGERFCANDTCEIPG